MKKGKNTKIVITNPKDAVRVLMDYLQGQTNSVYQIKGSRAKTATATEVVSWYNAMNKPNSLDLGWFGRSLMQAAKAGQGVSVTTIRDAGRTINVYHRPLKSKA